MNNEQPNALAIRDEQYALVPSSPMVQSIAHRFRWRPETTIARIKRALPSVLEQQIYLAIAPRAGESGILPESMAKLLRLFLGHQELQLQDIAPGSPGRMRFTLFAEFLGDCINLLKIVTKEYTAFSLSIENAGMIVLHYGKDDPERLIEMVDCNLEEMCEVLDISNNLGYSLRMRMCVAMVVKKVIPDNHRSGTPDLLDLTDFLNMPLAQRQNLRRALSEEAPDYLSADQSELKSYEELAILKEWGVW
jgi:hypothetical protein